MTASTGSLSDVGGSNSFAGGASSASLRNLGKQSTLILLNSRRVAPYALADYNEVFTNLDSLPLDAVERVEVLRSGGSSIYGSDAVAGVINIITRADYRGVTARAAHEQSARNSKFHESTADLTGGLGNMASDGYNVLANVEVFKRASVAWRDVVDDINPAYGNKFATLRDGSGLMFGNRGAPSTFSYPGNLIGQGLLPGCTTLNAAGLCVYDRYSRFEVQPEAERANPLLSGKLRISDSMEAFSEVLYSKTKTTYRGAFATYDSTAGITAWGNPATGQARTFDHRPIPAGHPLNTSGQERDLRYRFLDDPGYRASDSSQYRVLAGLKGRASAQADRERPVEQVRLFQRHPGSAALRCAPAQAYAEELRTQSDALPDTDPNKALYSAKADAVEGSECFGGVPSIVFNNPDLKPEVSNSGTVGFVVEPAKGINLSLDYWNIRRKDEINLKSNDELLASESQQPAGVINRLALNQDATFTDINGATTSATPASGT